MSNKHDEFLREVHGTIRDHHGEEALRALHAISMRCMGNDSFRLPDHLIAPVILIGQPISLVDTQGEVLEEEKEEVLKAMRRFGESYAH